MRVKILLVLLGALLSLLLSSCAVTPPDVPICFEIDMETGYCINTISSREFEVNNTSKMNGKTWWEARPYMLALPINSWVEIKTFIIKICKKTNRCDTVITNWERSVDKIDELTKQQDKK